MKRVGTIYAITLMITYVINNNVLKSIYPNAERIYEPGITYDQYISYLAEFEKYYILRNQLYEVMFFLTFLLFFLNRSGRLLKGVAAFTLFLSTASVIDKCFLNIYEFNITDYILLSIAGGFGVYFFHKKRNDTTIGANRRTVN